MSERMLDLAAGCGLEFGEPVGRGLYMALNTYMLGHDTRSDMLFGLGTSASLEPTLGHAEVPGGFMGSHALNELHLYPCIPYRVTV